MIAVGIKWEYVNEARTAGINPPMRKANPKRYALDLFLNIKIAINNIKIEKKHTELKICPGGPIFSSQTNKI